MLDKAHNRDTDAFWHHELAWMGISAYLLIFPELEAFETILKFYMFRVNVR